MVLRVLRSVVAILLMASTTFALGSVVGYQYHSIILQLKFGKGYDLRYRELKFRWYKIGVALGVPICYFFDDMRSTAQYSSILAGLVTLTWLGWCVHVFTVMHDHIHKLGSRLEFFFSCLSLGLISALLGAGMVVQVFTWFAWK